MEVNKRTCKVCTQLKDRIEAGRYNEKDKRFVDGNNKSWNGNVCPDCHRSKVKEAVKLKRQLSV